MFHLVFIKQWVLFDLFKCLSGRISEYILYVCAEYIRMHVRRSASFNERNGLKT